MSEIPPQTTSLSSASLVRISGFLLAVTAALLTAVITLAWYIISNKQHLAALEGGMLAQRELQEELMEGQKDSQALYPHTKPGISYVLNPYMKQASWKGPAEALYQINEIGLRGAEISAREKGVKRIALVGDSELFGWKLREQEKVASILQALLDERLGPGKFEFVTVAIPG